MHNSVCRRVSHGGFGVPERDLDRFIKFCYTVSIKIDKFFWFCYLESCCEITLKIERFLLYRRKKPAISEVSESLSLRRVINY